MIVDEFRRSIAPAIFKIIALLSDKEKDVRWQAIDSLEKFSEQGKNTQYGDEGWLTNIVDEFCEFVASAIPSIITLLGDEDKGVCHHAARSLGKFSEQGNIP